MPDRATGELQLRCKRQSASAHPSRSGSRMIGSCATGASHQISLLRAVRGKHVHGTQLSSSLSRRITCPNSQTDTWPSAK